MTEIEQKALALVNEVEGGNWLPHETDRIRNFATICRAIEQHEQFKREVSSVCEHLPNRPFVLDRFILPKPVDPLVEALKELDWCAPEKASDLLRAALAARGLEIREVGHD